MVGKSTDTYKRAYRVVVLNGRIHFRVTGEVITIDPQLPFQRLTAVADRYTEDISGLQSMFVDAIWKIGYLGKENEMPGTKCNIHQKYDNITVVFDEAEEM